MNNPSGQSRRHDPIPLALLKVWRAAHGMFAAVALAAFVSSCASTSTKSTWKSPDYQGGPLQKVAVVAHDDRMDVRMALENRFVRQLDNAGEAAFATAAAYPNLDEARKNKEATVASLRASGADSILITKLVSKSTYLSQPRQNYSGQVVAFTVSPGSDGWDASLSSYSSYSSAPRSDDRDFLVLETSLFELKTGHRVWSSVTEVKVLETAEKLEIADAFVAKVVEAMHKDGVIR